MTASASTSTSTSTLGRTARQTTAKAKTGIKAKTKAKTTMSPAPVCPERIPCALSMSSSPAQLQLHRRADRATATMVSAIAMKTQRWHTCLCSAAAGTAQPTVTSAALGALVGLRRCWVPVQVSAG